MAQVLERLDPYDTSTSYTIHEQVIPHILRGIEHLQRKRKQYWAEDEQQMEEPKCAHEYFS